MNTAIFTDKFRFRTSIGIWLPIILIEICLAAVGALLDVEPMLIIFLGIPFGLYLFLKPFHAYLLTILLLPFWEVTLSGVGSVDGQIDIRYPELAVAIASVSWLFNGLVTKKIHLEKNILYLPIAALVCWMLFSLTWAQNVYLGIKEFLLVLYGVVVFFLTIHNVNDKKTLNITLGVWVAAGFLCALSGMFELITTLIPAAKQLPIGPISHWGQDIRISGMKEGPDRLGLLLNFFLMITVSQLIVSKSKGYKIFLGFCIFTTLVVLLYTLSRAAWVGGFVGVASCCVYSKRLAKIFLISTLVTVILFVVLAPEALQNLVIERFMGVLNPTETKSIIGRESVWNAGMQMFKEHPLTGVGMGSFTVLATPYGSVHLMAPHDIYLFFLTEFGIIGLALFIVVIVITLFSLIRGLKNISDDTNNFILFGPFAGLVVYFTQGLVTSFKFLEMETWALLGLAVTALRIFTSEKEQANR